jgi:hypothetical protein
MNKPQFIRSYAPHVVEVADGSVDALSPFAELGTDVRQTEIDSTEFVQSDPSPELKPASFDCSSAIPGIAPQVLDLPQVSPNPQPNTSAPPAVPASAALGTRAIQPNPSKDQAQSHFSERISQLKGKNNHVLAALKRLESAPPNKA